MNRQDHRFAVFATGALAFAVLMGLWVTSCATLPEAPAPQATESPIVTPIAERPVAKSCCELAWGMKDGTAHKAVKGTGYYPANSKLEGGFKDRRSKPLRTLQSYLAGKADYVSTAMDYKPAPGFIPPAYGAPICIPELNARFGKPIKFRVVDTGGAFVGKQWQKLDVCTANEKASLDDGINSKLTVIECQ